MISVPAWFARSGRTSLDGVPEGYDALVLEHAARSLADQGRSVLHVARDDARLAQLAEALAFFAPELEVLDLPAWDCQPYDRVSPLGQIVGRRLSTLTRLAQSGGKAERPRVVITTVAALLQRVPPRAMLESASLAIKAGGRIEPDKLVDFFQRNGYSRTETVREAGEYAVRGGILDVFPAGAEMPLRLDFFGDTLDTIRSFDPMSQRTVGTETGVEFKPVSEVLLDEESVQRFRSGYRALFGTETSSDHLYEAVSAGRRHIGMEHWLPLFHETVETIFDYLPAAAVTLDGQVDASIRARLEQIAEYYQARKELMSSASREGNPYNPLPPDRLYLTAAELDGLLEKRAVASLSATDSPEGTGRVDAGGRLGREFGDARARPDVNLFDAVRDHLKSLLAEKRRVLVTAHSAGSRDRIKALLKDRGMAEVSLADTWEEAQKQPATKPILVVLGVTRGFTAKGLAFVTEADMLGDRLIRSTRKRRNPNFISEVTALAEGDLVVHVDHGIGRYDGLETLDIGGAPHDCLRVVYAGNDKLFVPVENIEVLSRFGSDEAGGQLDKLGGAGWQARVAKVRQRIRDMAEKLIKVAAERELRRGETLQVPEGVYDEFCARFPYSETEDQLRAIEDVIADLGSGKPMDRLICGDVGFGKTEVALRAAFVAAMSGVQVAVVVPTTLLARQHFRQFEARFKGLPVRVEQLSRLVTAKQATQVKQDLKDGKVDIVVGTHAVLAKSVEFKDLGLLIIDEEQHFGVAQKERLKELKANIHVLTLTATPIPRTLQLSLSGVRDMSIIATPPVDRLAVRTFVLPYDPVVLREAILREHFRGGQTFYVCPRVEDLDGLAERLRNLVPEVKFAMAHGRMAPTQLEDVMNAFTDGAYDILLSTNIVESGLDISSANTMIIHRADMFGLSQLYQLRGRIGRSKIRAYAYLTVPPNRVLTQTAEKRLDVMQTLDQLGAGFQLASHDMDIRGAGNLLGEEQSGHIKEVGVELYQHMLEEAVTAARAGSSVIEDAPDQWTPQIALGTPVLIPDTYIEDLSLRLSLYRRASTLLDRAEIDGFAAELVDRFGPLPPEVDNLLRVIQIKRLCRQAGVEKVDAGPKGAVLSFRHNDFADPAKLVGFIQRQSGTAKLRPDHKLVYMRGWERPEERIDGVQRLMEQLADMAA